MVERQLVELDVAGPNPVDHPFGKLRVCYPFYMKWYIYILLCDKKFFYVGLTSNLNQRFKSHQNKYNLATKEFKEVELIYNESYGTRFEAESREKQLKGWSRAKKAALVKGNIGLLRKLSKSRSVLN